MGLRKRSHLPGERPPVPPEARPVRGQEYRTRDDPRVPRGGEPPAQRRVDVEIDELVLDGFNRIDSGRVAFAFRQELSRLLAARHGGVPGPSGASGLERVELPASELSPAVAEDALGQSIARAVLRSMAWLEGDAS